MRHTKLNELDEMSSAWSGTRGFKASQVDHLCQNLYSNFLPDRNEHQAKETEPVKSRMQTDTTLGVI